MSYVWTPGTYLNNSSVLNPVVNATDNQLYTLTVTNTSNCTASASMNIAVFSEFRMPNAFVPGGKNNVLAIPHLYRAIKIHYFKIFNRYGQQIFETTDISKGWDGTLHGDQQPAGAYVWIVEYEHPITKKKILAQGSTLLLR